MTETRAPTQGQIDSPNPLELFWEKNRRPVLLVLTIAAVAVGTYYALQYFKQRELNQRWSAIATAAHLDAGYAEDGSWVDFLKNAQQQPGQQQTAFQWTGLYLQNTRDELVTRLQKDFANADAGALDAEIAVVQGTEAEPLLLWVKAVRSAQKADWDGALATLADLEKRFPDHFLCLLTNYPPQYRPAIEDPDKDNEAETQKRKRDKPELEPAVPGSPVTLLRAQIERERAFRAGNKRLYQAPDPDAEPEVVMKLSNDDEIRIRFYSAAAPEHVKNFLAKVREGFYDGQHIDEVRRPGTQGGFGAEGTPQELHFGLAASKSEDRSIWKEARAKPSDLLLDFEPNDQSHFPGMVAAGTEADGKSSGERIWINGTDAASRYDGDRVIFGRVVGEASLEAVERICSASLEDLVSNQSGRGQLQQNVQILSIDVVGEVKAPKKPEEPPKEDNEEGAGEEGKPGGEGKDGEEGSK